MCRFSYFSVIWQAVKIWKIRGEKILQIMGELYRSTLVILKCVKVANRIYRVSVALAF